MIRLARESDIADLVKLAEEFYQETSAFKHLPLDTDKVARHLRFAIENDGFYSIVATDKHGRPCGLLMGYIGEYWFSNATLTYDQMFYVRQKNRGGMIAPRMIKALEIWAKEKGVRDVYISSSSGIRVERFLRLLKKFEYKAIAAVTRKILGD